MLKRLRTKFIGDRQFYKKVLLIAIPIMIQNGITNFVNLLDNIMVGQVGTEPMSGVAIVNQLMLVFNLCIFGGVSGAGIFTAQYYGQGDVRGIKHTIRYKLWLTAIITISAVAILFMGGQELISLYLNDAESGNARATLQYGIQYLNIMLIGLPAFMVVQIYSSTLRECGETMVPMKAGIAAVLVNLVFNYLLIYGKFGFPELGVVGAAIATVISRYVEAFAVAFWTHYHKKKYSFVVGLYCSWKVPMKLVKRILIMGTPLLFNEALWGLGMATLNQCYSVRGLDVVAATNISTTISNVFNVVFIALGNSVSIIVGQLLGANKMKEAKDTDNKMIAFSVLACVALAMVMIGLSVFFPQLYNTMESAKTLAAGMIVVYAIFMPIDAFNHAIYFTLRSGGKTVITFFFDSGFIWMISVPIAFVLSRFTGMHVLVIIVAVRASELVKSVIGYALVKKGVWLQNIT